MGEPGQHSRERPHLAQTSSRENGADSGEKHRLLWEAAQFFPG